MQRFAVTRLLTMTCIATMVLAGCATHVPQPIQASSLPAPTVCAEDAAWTDPTAPRHIYGNTWYVGTCAISVILIATPQGHVLLDAGPTDAAASIEANIRTLGLRPTDVRYLLGSHEHMDHAGATAALQQVTGATVVARAAAAATLKRGKSDRNDPQLLVLPTFPAVAQVREIIDGERLAVGGLHLTAHATPGHTPGGTSWTWTSCEADQCRRMAYADSLSAISDDVYRYTDETMAPGAVVSFRQTLSTVAALPCDILLTPHPKASNLFARLERRADAPLVDSRACATYAAKAAKGLDERIAKERATAP